MPGESGDMRTNILLLLARDQTLKNGRIIRDAIHQVYNLQDKNKRILFVALHDKLIKEVIIFSLLFFI